MGDSGLNIAMSGSIPSIRGRGSFVHEALGGTIVLMLALGGWAVESLAEEPRDLGVVTVIGTKTERPIGEVAGTVTVIEADRIDDDLVHDLVGLFRYEPGISVSSDPNRFGIGDIGIRGVGGNRVAMEIDGVRLPQSFAIGSFSAAGRDYVDPELLKRVEILRGPASALYGSDALGGVVTYATKDPEDILLGRDRGYGLKSGYNGDDRSWQATMSGALRMSRVSALAAYSRREGAERDVAGTTANPGDYVDENWLAKFLFLVGDNGETTLSFGRSDSDSTTDVQSLVGGPGKFATTTALYTDDDRNRDTWNLSHVVSPSSGFVDALTTRVYYQHAETNQRTHQVRAASAREPDPTIRYRDFFYEERVDGAEALLEKDQTVGRVRHRWLFGAAIQRQRIEEERDGHEADVLTGAVTSIVLGEQLPVRDFPNSTTTRAGVFAQDEIHPAESRLTLIPGVRLDYSELDADPDRLFLEDNPEVQVASSREYSVSPKFGVLYGLSEHWTAFAQYARGFRAPPAEDVNIGLTIPAFNFVAIPNPGLQPERSNGIEVGLRGGTFGMSLSASAYYNRYRNLIESRVNLGVDPASGMLTFQSQNRERATIWGVELRAHTEFGRWWPALSGFVFDAALAYSRGDDDERNEPLRSVEPPTAVLGLTYTPAGGQWSVETVGTFVARKDRVDDSEIDAFEAPGFKTYDVFARYELTPRIRVRAGVFNIMDKTYWRWADVSRLPADYFALNLYAAPGRFLSLSFSIEL